MTTNTVPGISALQCVISSLRDTAHLSDEGGELTDQLRELRDWALSTAAQPPTGWPRASIADSCKGWTLDYKFLDKVEQIARNRTEYSTSMEATEQALIAALEVLAVAHKAAPAPAAVAEPVAWLHDDPQRYDVIHAEVKDLLVKFRDAAGYLHRPLDKSAHYTIPLYTADQLAAAVADAVAAERERCAQVCDRVALAWDGEEAPDGGCVAKQCADAIREGQGKG